MDMTEDRIPTIIEKVLKSNNEKRINREALNYFKAQLNDILYFFENVNSRRITSSSILMIVDNTTNKYELKIIDLASVSDYDSLE